MHIMEAGNVNEGTKCPNDGFSRLDPEHITRPHDLEYKHIMLFSPIRTAVAAFLTGGGRSVWAVGGNKRRGIIRMTCICSHLFV